MDLNAFIRTADPRKVRIVERPRAEHKGPIVTVAKHRTVTLLSTSVVCPSGELSASVEREFVRDVSAGSGGDEEVASIVGQDNVEPSVPITDNVGAEIPRPKRTKKKRVTRGSERTSAASHPPKRLRADYGTTGGFATGGKSPSVLNRLLQDSRLMVEQGVLAFPTLPFITSSVTASPLEKGGDHTDSVTGAKSADPEVDSFVKYAIPVMTEATTMTTIAPTVAIPADVVKDKSVPHPSIFGSSSSSEKTDRTLSLFTGRSGSGFAAECIRAEEAIGAGLEEIYVPEWTVTKGFKLNDGRLCANMIDHFTPPAFFKIVRGMEHEQLFTEFNESAARNLSLSSEGIEELKSQLLKAKEESVEVHELETSSTDLREKLEMYEGSLKQLKEFQDNLMRPLETRLAEIDADFTRCCMRFQESFHPHLLNVVAGRRWLLTHGMKLLMANPTPRVFGLEATENSLRGEVASTKEHNVLLEQECDSLKLKVTSLESTITEKDHELSDLGASSSSLRPQNQSLVNQVHGWQTLSPTTATLREEAVDVLGKLKQLKEFQDNTALEYLSRIGFLCHPSRPSRRC
ncbi:hypothetical protein Tco_0241822 [Tanacetum coccineum]